MIVNRLDLDAAAFEVSTGWQIKPEGACKGDVCVPLDRSADAGFDLVATADRLGMAIVADAEAGVWSIGPASLGGRSLTTAEAPELTLPDVLTGEQVSLSSFRGQKVAIASLGALLSCRFDLPGWQALRTEIHDQGVEIITVGLEMGGADVLRPIVEAARPEHPSLIDATHQMDTLFGVTNIPQVIWIDENGTIVRPAEVGSPAPQPTDDPFANFVFELMARGTPHPEWYGDRIRDWAAKGVDSEWVLSPDDVIAASHPRSRDVSEAAAHFALAQHFWRTEGFSPKVLHHFERAHTLQPENITYKRQAYSAWSFAKTPDDAARFAQSPTPGEEDQWPFVSEFFADAKEYMGLDLSAG